MFQTLKQKGRLKIFQTTFECRKDLKRVGCRAVAVATVFVVGADVFTVIGNLTCTVKVPLKVYIAFKPRTASSLDRHPAVAVELPLRRQYRAGFQLGRFKIRPCRCVDLVGLTVDPEHIAVCLNDFSAFNHNPRPILTENRGFARRKVFDPKTAVLCGNNNPMRRIAAQRNHDRFRAFGWVAGKAELLQMLQIPQHLVR